MILQFEVENYRSIKDELWLSIYADKNLSNLSDNYSNQIDGYNVLKTIGIFGANASGKSNILRALDTFNQMIATSNSLQQDDEIPFFDGYAFSRDTIKKPTKFSIEFYLDKLRYHYEFEYDEHEVKYECLKFYPSARSATLFLRDSADDWGAVRFGTHLKGGKKTISFFGNNLYLSKAGNTADSPEVLRRVFRYLRGSFVTVFTNQSISYSNWYKKPKFVSSIKKIMKHFDVGIQNFQIKKLEQDSQFGFKKALLTKLSETLDFPANIKDQLINDLTITFSMMHNGEDGEEYQLPLEDESEGTQRIFEILPALLGILQNGHVLILDELERSFHPLVAKFIVTIFNNPSVNRNNAQLIFTTHDMSLMNSDLFRRDQVYLVEKRENKTSTFSLESFDSSKLKSSSPFEKWYIDGRLGGTPVINNYAIECVLEEMLYNAKEEEE